MAIRPIDGNELYGIVKLMDTYVIKQSKTASFLLEQVLHDIQAMPTLTPVADMEETKLNELAKEIHENAVAHGWWDEERSLPEQRRKELAHKLVDQYWEG